MFLYFEDIMQAMNSSTELVLSCIKALDTQDYDQAASYLSEKVRIMGPAGEAFHKPKEFVGMLSQYRGKYDVRKIFSDGNDVCLIYELSAGKAKTMMCSWYKVENGKIVWIQTIFDPKPFNKGGK
jgi:SnoaL-like protein